MEAAPYVSSSPRRARVAELGPIFLSLVAGPALVALRLANGEAYDRAVLPALSFGLIVAVPGLLGLMALRRRPGLYLAAGLVLLSMSWLSIATFPLLFVAAMAFVAYGRHADEEAPVLWAPLTAMIIFILSLMSVAVLFLVGQDDPRCSSTATSTSCTSDVITNGESLAALGLFATTLAVGWVLSKPKRAVNRATEGLADR